MERLDEQLITGGKLVESDKSKLPSGILCKVVYPVCNIGKLNANRRIYRPEVWEHVFADESIKTKIRERRLFGHAEHPDQTQSKLDLTSHFISDMRLSEDRTQVLQEMSVVDTPAGRIVDALLRAGCQVPVSTRAEGDLDEQIDESGNKFFDVVPESYRYTSTDFTADPSTLGAIPLEIKRGVTETIHAEFKDSVKPSEQRFAKMLLESLQIDESSTWKEIGWDEEGGPTRMKGKRLVLPVDYRGVPAGDYTVADVDEKGVTILFKEGGKERLTYLGDLAKTDAHFLSGNDEKTYLDAKKNPKPEESNESKLTVQEMVTVKEFKVGTPVLYGDKKAKISKIEESAVLITTLGGSSVAVSVQGDAEVLVGADNQIRIVPVVSPTPVEVPGEQQAEPEPAMEPEVEAPVDNPEQEFEDELSDELGQDRMVPESIRETKTINAMYKKAGLPVPDGKGIHTKAFHKLSVEVAKGYLKKGDSKEVAMKKGYATAMKQLGKEKAVKAEHRKDESASILGEITRLKIAEATARAEVQALSEAIESGDSSKIQIKMAMSKIKGLKESLTAAGVKEQSLLSELGIKSKKLDEMVAKLKVSEAKIKDLTHKLDESTKKLVEASEEAKEATKRAIAGAEAGFKEEQSKAVSEAVESANAEHDKRIKAILREYIDGKLGGLTVSAKVRALLEQSKTLAEIDESLEEHRDWKRRRALREAPVEDVIVESREPKVDPKMEAARSIIRNVLKL
jgi:hypothetical protein